jgi:hypothetical protein
MAEQPGWYFTAPWDAVPIRRGDALGLRAGADYFADLLAPGLSNATSDARWISLLSWCLQWSHVAWSKAGGGDLSRRDDQRARYAWLRPLELMWVDRALESGQTTGQLRGRRRIEQWRNGGRKATNFSMSPDQFKRYRQIGMYGAYRVVLRKFPELTKDCDGWTPGQVGLELANLVNKSLGHARLEQAHFKSGTKWGSWNDGDEACYWLKRGWQKHAHVEPPGYLPTPDDAASKQLPDQERQWLAGVLFAPGSRQLTTADVLAKATHAGSHADLCDALAKSAERFNLPEPHGQALRTLPAFSRFADAAMRAMRQLWKEINQNKEKQAPDIQKLANTAELSKKLSLAHDAGIGWLDGPTRESFPHYQVMTKLAEAMRAARTPLDQLRALANHHYEHGGGRRWFHEKDGMLAPLVPDTGIAASDYRFRLYALSRLAAQCGVADMGHAHDVVSRSEFDSDEPSESEDDEGENA